MRASTPARPRPPPAPRTHRPDSHPGRPPGRPELDRREGATSYNVKRGTSTGGPYTTINPGAVTVTSFTDSTALNGTTYYYVVTAVNGGGESLNSNQALATPQPARTQPDLLPPGTATRSA